MYSVTELVSIFQFTIWLPVSDNSVIVYVIESIVKVPAAFPMKLPLASFHCFTERVSPASADMVQVKAAVSPDNIVTLVTVVATLAWEDSKRNRNSTTKNSWCFRFFMTLEMQFGVGSV